MLWLKSLHIVFVVTWFAGLFYLPRLFVYHAMSEDAATRQVLKTMQGKLMIMTHLGGALAWLFGLALLLRYPQLMSQGWMQLKLPLVLLLSAYHFWCWRLVGVFARDANRRSHRWYRWFNEVPVVFLLTVVILAVVKPF